jgi:GT2 family glycosyltransferase
MTDIIIVLYGDRKDLDRCVTSVEEHCTDYKLHIIDNNPPNENLGFTKANNQGIKAAGTGEYFWLLNQDAVVLEGAQQALIDRFSYGEQVGIVGSKQLDPDNHDIIRFCGADCCFPAGRHKGGLVSMGHGRIPEKQKWLNFASVMIKRTVISKVGLLDESMYLLYSDSSYCYSCRQAGYECWYEPRSQVLHRLNASKNVSEWHKKDMEAFMKKWGITYDKETNTFQYSDLFQKLDLFP